MVSCCLDRPLMSAMRASPERRRWITAAHYDTRALACHVGDGEEDSRWSGRVHPPVRGRNESERLAVGRQRCVHEDEACARVERVGRGAEVH